MAEKHETGKKGEELAVAHLRSLGYEILHVNWRYLHLEIDIVARDGNELVIVEVKSRGVHSYEHPLEAISNQKIRHLVNAAEAYIIQHDLDFETRFDVISIVFFSTNKFKLDHFKSAFYPTVR